MIPEAASSDASRVSRRAAVVCVASIALAFSLAGCTTAVALDLDEASANRVTAALDENGVATERVPDPNAEGRWKIDVGRDDAARAASILADEDLPAKKTNGLMDTLSDSALVPSRASEQTRILAGTAGELERTLDGIDGVLSSRVHLAAPHADPLSDREPPRPSASVLIRYRGTESPISTDDVRRLVSGAVPDLSADRVAVVALAAAKPPPSLDVVLLGPFSVARSGAQKLRALLGAAALLNVALVACVGLLWSRARGLRKKPLSDERAARDLR